MKPIIPNAPAISANKKPEPENVSVRAAREAWLEPVPVPEVVESNTETAWGRWEESLQPAEPDFEDTVPMDDAQMEALKKLLDR